MQLLALRTLGSYSQPKDQDKDVDQLVHYEF